ncbi:hypothetical protein BGX28_010326 [Mortierella sp. GBA30]|nr:hypothetical protein BGX28_010326 [Mortierella sp. GBA30]
MDVARMEAIDSPRESSSDESTSSQDEAPSSDLRNRRPVNDFPWGKKAEPKQRYTPRSSESPSAQSCSDQNTPVQEQTESISWPATETSCSPGGADPLPLTSVPSLIPPLIPHVVWPVTQPMVPTHMMRKMTPRLSAIVDDDDDDEDNNTGHTSVTENEDRDYETPVGDFEENRLVLAMEELQMADPRSTRAPPPTLQTRIVNAMLPSRAHKRQMIPKDPRLVSIPSSDVKRP